VHSQRQTLCTAQGGRRDADGDRHVVREAARPAQVEGTGQVHLGLARARAVLVGNGELDRVLDVQGRRFAILRGFCSAQGKRKQKERLKREVTAHRDTLLRDPEFWTQYAPE